MSSPVRETSGANLLPESSERSTVQVAIRVDGFDATRAKFIESELATITPVLDGVLQAAGTQRCPSVQIWVAGAGSFERLVDEAVVQLGLRSRSKYSAHRQAVRAIGKTLSNVRGDQLQTLVIVDGTLWTHDGGEARAMRLVTVLHEFGHVALAEQRFEGGGDDLPRGTWKRDLLWAADVVWEECIVDSLVDEIIIGFRMITDADQKPLGMSDLQGPGLLENAAELLQSFLEWTKERVQRYRETGEGLSEIVTEVQPRLMEFFTVIGHLVGSYAGPARLEELRSSLQPSPGFRTLLAPDWDDLVGALLADRTEGAQRVAAVMTAFVARLGVVIEDVEDGLYVRVTEPASLGLG